MEQVANEIQGKIIGGIVIFLPPWGRYYAGGEGQSIINRDEYRRNRGIIGHEL